MKALAPTHKGTPPTPVAPDEPASRAGRRLLDLDDQPVRFPSDAFCGRETITLGEWLRRHAATYGDRGAVEWREVAVLAVLALCALVGLALLLVGAFDGGLGEGLTR